MIIIPLVEDSKSKNFYNERGLSLYIEVSNKKIIFDFGKSDKFIKNASILGINLEEIDYFIVSHGHSDHFKGITYLDRKLIHRENTYFSRESKSNFQFNILGYKKNIGSTNLPLDGLSFNSILQVDKDMFLIKSKKRNQSQIFLRDNLVDEFNHEIHLVIIENKKINIITGCCHSGIFNLINSVIEVFPNMNINSIIGGIHSRSYFFKPFKMLHFIQGIKKYNISRFILGHCTGKVSLFIFSLFIKNVTKLNIGKTYSLK